MRMSRLKKLITEVHRRSIWQVLGIYLVGFWVAYQITLGIVEGLGLPDWVPPFAIILFIIGLPIVLATAGRCSGRQRSHPCHKPRSTQHLLPFRHARQHSYR
jgi:hypothetical protein